jgi:hypothetical protein
MNQMRCVASLHVKGLLDTSWLSIMEHICQHFEGALGMFVAVERRLSQVLATKVTL